MKKALLILMIFALTEVLVAKEIVSIPWQEFKKLYKESIQNEFIKTQMKPPLKKHPLVYSIEEAAYYLTIGQKSAGGEMLISGKIISGDPAPIPLFSRDIVITRVKQVTGGVLLSGQEAEKILFLPDGKRSEFQIILSFLVQAKEDGRSRFISFTIPASIKNSLHLKLAADIKLLEEPGIADTDSVYHFSATTSMNIRFLDKKDLATVSLVDIDSFSQIRLLGKRAIITSTFVPVKLPSGSFILQVQENAQYISSTLKASLIKKGQNNSYEITLPSGEAESFSFQFAVEESTNANEFIILLPKIEDNNGKEGNFIFDEPDDGQITLTSNGLISDMPIARLTGKLTRIAGKHSFYKHILPHEPIRLSIKRFRTVSSPPTVLDSQSFFISFEENGNVLSVLVVDIPPAIGAHLKIKAIPDTEIWSLTVNGRKRKVYTNDDKSWIIPLESGEVSHVQLALLRKGEKLGLHGRLEAILPETGLPSRTVRVGIALPERVQLLSFEGPVSPASGESWKTPLDFIGKPYFFCWSFYKGQGMKLSFFYKEPVK